MLTVWLELLAGKASSIGVSQSDLPGEFGVEPSEFDGGICVRRRVHPAVQSPRGSRCDQFGLKRRSAMACCRLRPANLAKQADACVVQYGETVVITAVARAPSAGDRFFPADVRLPRALGGGRQVSRRFSEARRSPDHQRNAQSLDGPPDPAAVPQGFQDEVQSSRLSCQRLAERRRCAGDERCRRALHISSLPFQGPIASVRVGKVDGQLLAFPRHSDLEKSELDMIVSGSRDQVAMIEGFAQEMPEDEMMEAIQFAHGVIREVIDLQEELYQKVNPTKKEYVAPADDGCCSV
jgi:polyribonucleotide nucleotidyltransferase